MLDSFGLVEGGEAFDVTASRWGGVLGLALKEAWASRGWGSFVFNRLRTGRCAGLVIEINLG